MKKILVLLITLVCISHAIEYSSRIKALGTDFANLIPDYETDIYNNPQLLGEKLLGIAYEPDKDIPLTLRVLTKRFGWCGAYWANHRNNKLIDAVPINITSISVNDLWMLDLRGKLPKLFASDIWNLFNDGSYYKKRIYFNPTFFDTISTIKYLFSANGAYKIGEYMTLVPKVCAGIYFYNRNVLDFGYGQRSDQILLIYSGKIGVYYRNAPRANKFTSCYLSIGGPVSTSEIDNLPYSVFSHLSEVDIGQTFFAKTIITKIGWAKGIPLNDNGFVAIGLRDVFMFQRTDKADTNIALRGCRNTLSLPIALERAIGKIVLRIGTRLCYTFQNDRG